MLTLTDPALLSLMNAAKSKLAKSDKIKIKRLTVDILMVLCASSRELQWLFRNVHNPIMQEDGENRNGEVERSACRVKEFGTMGALKKRRTKRISYCFPDHCQELRPGACMPVFVLKAQKWRSVTACIMRNEKSVSTNLKLSRVFDAFDDE